MRSEINPRFFSENPAAVLRVTGEDALAFLQGQFTQELRFPGGRLCTYGLWLNQKGKVLADSYALRDGDTWWLVSTGSPSAMIRERLEAYIIADDVTLEDATDNWQLSTFLGEGAAEWLKEKGVILPGESMWHPYEGGFIFRGRRDSVESWEWLTPRVPAIQVPSFISEVTHLKIDLDEVERRRISAGIPRVPQEIGPGDLPNEGGLEDEAVSYSKGCYLGQEVMARLKSMGQVRRRLLRVRGSGVAPSCPAPLFAGEKRIGELRSAVRDASNSGYVGFAMLSLIGLEGATRLSLTAGGDGTVEVDTRPRGL